MRDGGVDGSVVSLQEWMHGDELGETRGGGSGTGAHLYKVFSCESRCAYDVFDSTE